jgi:hypothetical protein
VTVGDMAGKPATAARMYDYYLGGVHNFPADRAAAKQVTAVFPFVPAAARANRAFLGRAVRLLVDAGIRQFLDIGSGIPTAGNVHEIAQAAAPDSRVVYVDIDPVAVSEGQEILARNDAASALLGDLRDPAAILAHPGVTQLLDLGRPTALLLCAVLHFVPADAEASDLVGTLTAALAPGSHLVASHAAAESFLPVVQQVGPGEDVYRRRTATPGTVRTRDEVRRFFDGLDLLEPGVVWASAWRPDGGGPAETEGGIWAGVGRKN